jgi:iron complex outermembrane recepter protein
MKQPSLMLSLWVMSVVSGLAINPAYAKTPVISQSHQVAQSPTGNIVRITGVELFDTDTGLEIALQSQEPEKLKPVITTSGNTLIADISNARIDTPNGEQFDATNPIKGISLLRVRNFEGSRVRVEIIGENAPPKATFSIQGKEFVVAISTGTDTPQANQPAVTEPPAATKPETEEPPAATKPETEEPPAATKPETEEPQANQEPEEPIELVVTGDREQGFRVQESNVGTRTDTPIINVPQSIQVIPEQVIEEQGITTLGETLRNTAGVTSGRLASDAPAITPVIRGFESGNVLRNGQRDTTLRRVAGTPNIERVEILRGPASVLFGQGDLGGTVSVVTKQPTNEPFAQIEYQVGQFGLHRPSLDIGGPFGNDPKNGGYRFNLSYEWSDSFRKFEESETFFVSPVVRLINTDQTQLTAELEYIKYRTRGGAPELPALGTVINNPAGKIDRTVNLGEPSLAESETTATRLGYQLRHKLNNNWSISNEFLLAATETPESTGGFPRALRRDGRTLDRILLVNPSSESSLNLNTNVIGKFDTGGIKHELLFGVEYSQDSIEDAINIRTLAPIDIFNPRYQPNIVGRFDIPIQDTKNNNDTFGFYIQDQISLFDSLILVLGGRFDIASQSYEDRLDDRQSFDRTDEAFSPRVGLVYKPSKDVSLYASYTRSFKPQIGREQELDPITNDVIYGDPFLPERGTQYEVGIKADLFDQRLSTTLAFYHLERTNVALSGSNDPVSAQQAGLQRSQGIELNIAGEVAPGWNILASYAYTDARIVEDDRYPEGNFLFNVPKNAASLWTSYQIQSGALRGFGLGLGLFYVGERQGDLENSFELPSYVRTDAALFYKGDRFGASLNFQNLFDTEYYEGARGNLRVIPGAPFTVFGRVSWEF